MMKSGRKTQPTSYYNTFELVREEKNKKAAADEVEKIAEKHYNQVPNS